MATVIWYIPNLINYFRVLLVLAMLVTIKHRPFTTFLIVLVTGLIDDFDGPIARYFNQTSKYGAVLDISLDRFTTTIQLFFLATAYPKYWMWFLVIQFSEIYSDFVREYSQNYAFKLGFELIEKDSIYDLTFLNNFLPLVW